VLDDGVRNIISWLGVGLTFVLNVLHCGVIDITLSVCLSFNYTMRITSGLCLLVALVNQIVIIILNVTSAL
jgi:hypothetical protein